MKLFTIHAPLGPPVLTGPESARAARTGFSFAALIFGPIWLLLRALWLALAGYAMLAALVVGLVAFGVLRPGGGFALFALANLYLAVEGRALALAARARGGRPLADVIYARSAVEAEKIYLERALSDAPAAPSRSGDRREEGVIGVFPEPRR